jgi:hypothetical protein
MGLVGLQPLQDGIAETAGIIAFNLGFYYKFSLIFKYVVTQNLEHINLY